MKSLHSKKIAAEKDAFLGELLSGLPKADRLLASGDLSARARRLHEEFLPVHILSHYRPTDWPLKTDYFDLIMSQLIECECIAVLGFHNAGMVMIRSALESAFKLIYYEYHPVEWQLHATGKHTLHGLEYREFLYSVPKLNALPFIRKGLVEVLWSHLCEFVHSDLRTVSQISVVGEIKSVLGLPEAKFVKLLGLIHQASKLIVACCLAVDPKWLLGVEKAYFDAVFDIYTVPEKRFVKEGLSVA